MLETFDKPSVGGEYGYSPSTKPARFGRLREQGTAGTPLMVIVQKMGSAGVAGGRSYRTVEHLLAAEGITHGMESIRRLVSDVIGPDARVEFNLSDTGDGPQEVVATAFLEGEDIADLERQHQELLSGYAEGLPQAVRRHVSLVTAV